MRERVTLSQERSETRRAFDYSVMCTYKIIRAQWVRVISSLVEVDVLIEHMYSVQGPSRVLSRPRRCSLETDRHVCLCGCLLPFSIFRFNTTLKHSVRYSRRCRMAFKISRRLFALLLGKKRTRFTIYVLGISHRKSLGCEARIGLY